jgi:hypothetical protein
MLRLIFLGFRDLPGYGPHPGVPFVFILTGAGALAGAKSGGWCGLLVGAVVMAVPMGALLCMGAYSRARDYERDAR